MTTARTEPLRLAPPAALRIREEIERAGGREVCFLARVTADRVIEEPRAVARGNRHAVLAAASDAERGEIMIHNHPSGVLEPSDADLVLAQRIWEAGLGTAITDNRAQGLYVVVEPPRPRERVLLDEAEIDELLGPGGALEAEHPGFEDRPGQRRMARAVARSFNDSGVLVVEAGTGTGKSLAYLLPSALWASRNGERTVISTNTINLQEQLVEKDLPLVAGLTGGEVKWALVKGRGNYISIRRLRLALESAPSLFETDRSSELEALEAWVRTTRDGSLADLAAPPSPEVWDEVRSDGDVCMGARCPHYQDCFHFQARRKASAAEILVVNHALLLADIAVRRAADIRGGPAVLPDYAHVVLDEGHNVEDVATQHLGAEVTRTGVLRLLGRIERKDRGILPVVRTSVRAEAPGPARDGILARIQDRGIPAVARARQAAERFFLALDPRVPQEGEPPLRLGRGDPRDPEGNPELEELLDRLRTELGRLARELDEVRIRLEMDEARAERMGGHLLDLSAAQRRLETHRGGLGLVLDPGEKDVRQVRWIEGRGPRGRSDRNLVLSAAPVEPGPLLRESLFEPMQTSVITSATLTTRGGDFGFLRSRLGLGPEVPGGEQGAGEAPATLLAADVMEAVTEPPDLPPVHRGRPLAVEELQVASPFQWSTQALMAIPSDIPRPGAPGRAGSTADVVTTLAGITGGGLFVLFTSYRALRAVAAELRRRGVDGKYPLLVHGEGHRARLQADFIQSGRAILLGTSSFWEGVDVPGRPLRGLVLDKIPFRVPDEPVTQARTEALEERGLNGFGAYHLPLAALRLRQGFGRLIRSRSDRGVVVLLDPRILTARYGPRLLSALPEVPIHRGPWATLVPHLESFQARSPSS
ncbi:MAG: helicase [Gemmatimonadales bacterium]|nr:MAG: helicase [Gemmatimonadales bacterium]